MGFWVFSRLRPNFWDSFWAEVIFGTFELASTCSPGLNFDRDSGSIFIRWFLDIFEFASANTTGRACARLPRISGEGFSPRANPRDAMDDYVRCGVGDRSLERSSDSVECVAHLWRSGRDGVVAMHALRRLGQASGAAGVIGLTSLQAPLKERGCRRSLAVVSALAFFCPPLRFCADVQLLWAVDTTGAPSIQYSVAGFVQSQCGRPFWRPVLRIVPRARGTMRMALIGAACTRRKAAAQAQQGECPGGTKGRAARGCPALCEAARHSVRRKQGAFL